LFSGLTDLLIGNIIPLFHPFTRQPVAFQSKTVRPQRYIPVRNAKLKALTKIKAITTRGTSDSASPTPSSERNIVDPDTDEDTVNHEDGDTVDHEDGDTAIDEDEDTDTDTDTSTNRIPFDKRPSPDPPVIEKLSSSEYGFQVGETLYFVFQNMRFPCKRGTYRVLFDVVVKDYQDDQDNRFPPVDLWP
jgi:hypothetical protein